MPRAKKKVEQFVRRYETDYAGSWRGYCKTRESAIVAAIKNMVGGIFSRCTITDRATGETVARLSLTDNRKRVVVDTMKPLKKAVGL